MITGKTVKIRFKRYFAEQRLWVFIGKVLEFTESWIKIEGKGIIFLKGQVQPADIDKEPRIILVPREHIAHIRVLPDNFDITKLKVETRGLRLFVKVPGGPDTSVGEA